MATEAPSAAQPQAQGSAPDMTEEQESAELCAMPDAMELVGQEGTPEPKPAQEQTEPAVGPPDTSAEDESVHNEEVAESSAKADAMDVVEEDKTPEPKLEQERTEPMSVSPMEADSNMQTITVQVAALKRQQQKPKKPVTAFWLYFGSMRAQVTQELKEKTGKAQLGEIAKIIGERWKTLPDEERKVFEDNIAEDKQRYEVEMRDYLDACDPTAALRRKHAHLIPKKPVSAQHVFFKEAKQRAVEGLRADSKDTTEKAITAKLLEMWKDVSAEEKNGYQQTHTQLYLDFLGLQKVWQATPEFAEIEQVEKARQAVEKAVEMAKAAETAKAAKAVELAKRAAKRGRGAAAQTSKEVTPKKARGSQSAPQSAEKKPTQANKVVTPSIDDKVLKEASKMGLEAALQNLAGRPEVVSSRKSARAILDALKASGGLINPAKRVLLGL